MSTWFAELRSAGLAGPEQHVAAQWLAGRSFEDGQEPPELHPGVSAASLNVLDPSLLGDDELLGVIQVAGRLACWAYAMQDRALAVFGERRPAWSADEILLADERLDPYAPETEDNTFGVVIDDVGLNTAPDAAHHGGGHGVGGSGAEADIGDGGTGADADGGDGGGVGAGVWAVPRLMERSAYAGAEVAAVLGVGRGSADRLMARAETVVRFLPGVRDLHERGLLDPGRIRAVTGALANAPVEVYAAVDAAVLPVVRTLPVRSLERFVRRAVERFHPEPLAVRHGRARRERDVWFWAREDGMAELGALLPAVQARAYFDTVEAWAASARAGGEPSEGLTATGRPSRAVGEYRADSLMDLLDVALGLDAEAFTAALVAANPGSAEAGNPRAGYLFRSRPAARVHLFVPALTLLGAGTDAAELDGYGPIPLEAALKLAGEAVSWIRVLTDPETGTVLSVGRRRYEPPADLRRYVMLRDRTCRGIGCDRPAKDCQIDHTVPFHRRREGRDGQCLPPGETADDNLGPYCLADHHLKDDPGSGWSVVQDSPGIFTHTSPTGRRYTKAPEPPLFPPPVPERVPEPEAPPPF